MQSIARLIIVFVVVFVVFTAFMIAFYYREQNKKHKETLFVNNVNARVRLLHSLYSFFSTFFLTRNFIRKIERRYRVIDPGQPRKVEEETIKTALIIWCFTLSMILLGALLSFNYLTIIVIAIEVYCFTVSVLFSLTDRNEKRLLEQFKKFLDDLAPEYMKTRVLESSIEEVLINSPEPIHAHMERILEILNSDMIEEDTRAYIKVAPNQFLTLFLSAAEQVVKFGDREVDNFSLFVKNISLLSVEIDTELNCKRMLSHKLKLLAFLAVFPLVLFGPIERWAVVSFSEIEAFYHSAYGIVTPLVLCLLSFLVFSHVHITRTMALATDGEHLVLNYIYKIPFLHASIKERMEKNYGKYLKTERFLRHLGETLTPELLYLKRVLYMIGGFFLAMIVGFFFHYSSKSFMLTDRGGLESNYVVLIPDEEQRELVVEELINLTVTYKDSEIDREKLRSIIEKKELSSQEDVTEQMVEDLYGRIISYQNNYFHFYELVYCIAFGALGYFLPLLFFAMKKGLIEIIEENEVVQFQCIILMMMYNPRITVDEILDWMVLFADVFRQSLEDCVYAFPAGEMEALYALKEKEPFPAFESLVSSLIMADKVGVEKAFLKLDAERKNFQEKRKADYAIYIDNKSAMLSLESLLPFLAVIICMMVVPVMLFANNLSSNMGV